MPSCSRYNMVLLLSLHILLGLSDVIYISPSQDDCKIQYKICLTLDQLANNTISIKDNTKLIFFPGNHTLKYDFSIFDLPNLTMLVDDSLAQAELTSGTRLLCQQKAKFEFVNIEYLNIEGLHFIGCGNNKFYAVKEIIIHNSTFQGNNDSGTAMDITFYARNATSNITITKSYFISNVVGVCTAFWTADNPGEVTYLLNGGAIRYDCLASSCYMNIVESTFRDNSAELGGAIIFFGAINVTIFQSMFVGNWVAASSATAKTSHCPSSNNTAPKSHPLDGLHSYREHSTAKTRHTVTLTDSDSDQGLVVGGVIATVEFQSSVTIHSSVFINNMNLDGDGGVFFILNQGILEIHSSVFYDNHALRGGGSVMLVMGYSEVTMDNCTVHNSRSQLGGVINAGQAIVTIISSELSNNSVKNTGGVIKAWPETHLKLISSKLTNNKADSGGALHAIESNATIYDCVFMNNTATNQGGAIVFSQTSAYLGETSTFFSNSAATGGALYMVESALTTYYSYNTTTVTMIQANMAFKSGGGIYLYRCELKCMYGTVFSIEGNRASDYGGGLYASNSLIALHNDGEGSLIRFARNAAQKGGGIYLESSSQLQVIFLPTSDSINMTTELSFEFNSANYGEAIYVSDETYYGVCSRGVGANDTAINNNCFLQVFSPEGILDYQYVHESVTFLSNSSSARSALLFGGLLDRCTLDQRAEVVLKNENLSHINGVSYLKLVSNIDTNHISSGPVRLCLCSIDNTPNCENSPVSIRVMKGELFNISLEAVDQVNHTVNNVMVHSLLKYTESGLISGQLTQMTKTACTTLQFNVFSPHSFEELTLYPEGPCRNSSRSQMRVSISFLPCNCPVIGFKPKQNESKSCDCVCDPRMSPYIVGDDCDYQSRSLTRTSNFWIASLTHYAGNFSGYVIYPHCPLDYCQRNKAIHINLNRGNGTDDTQCANNRSGILCGKCQPGLSLSLGSSKCLHCSKSWYRMFSVILVAGLLAGVVLVVVLMTLNLTVAIGTLNGIIFYANVLGATSGTGLSNRIPSILISWLNLEIGLDVCFFEGMDMYWKTWLQLAFPSYVILLVVLIVIVSEHSVKFSQLLARKNPVATLDTLILLSYTTLLQTAITALSLAKLEYPDGSSQWVWLADGNVHYGRGKHIALIVVAILILMLGVAYTSLLFFWQWIVPRQDKLLFKWARSQQLCHFLEPYHAPYNFEHRYWTGLLLLVRVILSLVFSLNVSGDQGINLLAITLLVGALLFLRAQTGRLYKRKIIDWFEMICYLNVGLFSVIKLYLLKADNVTANSVIEYISVLITLILIMAVMLAHMWTEVCLKCFKCAPQRIKDDDDQRYPSEIDANAGQADQPTYSVIERPCLPTNTQELKDPVSKSSIPCCPNDGGDDKNEFEDAVDSSTSSESLTTLLIKCHKN